MLEIIADADQLYRRILNYFMTKDGRISSAAYKVKKKPPKEPLSVDVARLTTPEDSLSRGVPGQRVIEVRASVPRGLGLDVVHDPTEENSAHALIRGVFTAEICDRLAHESRPVL